VLTAKHAEQLADQLHSSCKHRQVWTRPCPLCGGQIMACDVQSNPKRTVRYVLDAVPDRLCVELSCVEGCVVRVEADVLPTDDGGACSR